MLTARRLAIGDCQAGDSHRFAAIDRKDAVIAGDGIPLDDTALGSGPHDHPAGRRGDGVDLVLDERAAGVEAGGGHRQVEAQEEREQGEEGGLDGGDVLRARLVGGSAAAAAEAVAGLQDAQEEGDGEQEEDGLIELVEHGCGASARLRGGEDEGTAGEGGKKAAGPGCAGARVDSGAACKPSSVLPVVPSPFLTGARGGPSGGDGHFSGPGVADGLKRSTRPISRTGCVAQVRDLCHGAA